MYKIFWKRFFDIIIAFVALICLLIPAALIALVIKIDSEGPALFVQKRLGWNGTIFNIYKFRTMTHKNRVSREQVMPSHPEVTPAGKMLRRFKLDEIPQFLNVLRGDMSLIGPRPCLPELMERFDENGHLRLKVRPGLFGLSDIMGGYYLTWPQRWVYDRIYVEKLSFFFDIKLAFKVIPVILFDENFYLKKN